MSKKLLIFLLIKEKILNLLKNFFLLHNKNSELMDVRSFNVSHFVKAEPLDKNYFFSKKVLAYLNAFHRKKNFLSMMNKKG